MISTGRSRLDDRCPFAAILLVLALASGSIASGAASAGEPSSVKPQTVATVFDGLPVPLSLGDPPHARMVRQGESQGADVFVFPATPPRIGRVAGTDLQFAYFGGTLGTVSAKFRPSDCDALISELTRRLGPPAEPIKRTQGPAGLMTVAVWKPTKARSFQVFLASSEQTETALVVAPLKD